MSDACCGHDASRTDDEPERLWEVSELRFAAVSGVFLLAALIAGWGDAPRAVESTLQALALVVGAYTFVPATLTRLVRGRIGVGTLMTIAAVGAVVLGEVGEAAMLAFLFSIANGVRAGRTRPLAWAGAIAPAAAEAAAPAAALTTGARG